MVYYYVQAEFSSIEGTFIIEFRAEFSSIEGTFNNHELTLMFVRAEVHVPLQFVLLLQLVVITTTSAAMLLQFLLCLNPKPLNHDYYN